MGEYVIAEAVTRYLTERVVIGVLQVSRITQIKGTNIRPIRPIRPIPHHYKLRKFLAGLEV